MPTLRLPHLFTDHAVLQRHRPVPIWGWTTPGARVTATLAGAQGEGTADANGRFELQLPPQLAGGPYALAIRTSEGLETILQDVLVGEVWLCSGQSNMEWSMSISGYSTAEVAAGGPAGIRLFHVPNRPSATPQQDVETSWTLPTAVPLGRFSGVAYAFGSLLHRTLGIPIGLIQSAWGGTAAEWWTPTTALDADPLLRPIMDRLRAMPPLPEPSSPAYAAALAEWEQKAFHQDPGNVGEGKGWAAPDCPLTDWQTMTLPTYWENVGLDMDGAVWFRKTVTVPRAWIGRDLTLSLGPIDDFDTTYVNGVRVGGVGKETPNAYQVDRLYPVPARLVTGERVHIAVRVFDHLGNGGIYGQAGQLLLHPAGEPKAAIALAGEWHYRIELRLPSMAWSAPPPTSDSHALPARLWNGMIVPLAPYALAGAIWYQGESNADRAEQYRVLMRTMISCWRALFGGPLPFYQVQLAPFMHRRPDPQESAWAELREAQEQVGEDLPDVDCAVIIDSGDELDIHPRNKALVGRRLARIALAKLHGVAIEHAGPTLAACERAGDSMRLRFRHCEGGLVASGGGPVRGFAIAGADRKFVWAEATIDADTVVVRAPGVAAPEAVRYAWADFPVANLMNQDGLPARPFRTDRWPGLTTGKR